MDIGGHDYVLDVQNDDSFNIIVKYMDSFWTNAIFENATGVGFVTLDKAKECDEFFIYKDEASLELWEKDIPTKPEDMNTMFYFILQNKCVTLVCDEETPEMLKVVDDLLRLLKSESLTNEKINY